MMMANCGFTQIDLAELKKSEINFENGSITRKRSKTDESSEDVPTVTRKLWPETLTELKQHKSPAGDLVFRTRTGQPIAYKRIGVDGKVVAADSVANIWTRFLKKQNLPVSPLSRIRKTSATFLKDDYRELVDLFLGNVAKKVSDIYYAAESVNALDKAIDHLHTVYFGSSTPIPKIRRRRSR